MPFSSGLSPQMKMLTAQQQSDIMADYARSPDASGPPPSINMLNNGVRISGPIFAGDEAASPATVGPLTRAQVFGDTPQQESEAQGALSRAAPALPRHSPPDITEMLKQYMPQDDSQSRYLALAAGLLSPTKTGSFGEQLGNVASAMQIQRAEQEKMRAQYVPLIMQQVAAQQAREEQARYRLEAQQQAQAAQAQAAQQAQAARAEMAQQAQQMRADQASRDQRFVDERAAADRASRESIAMGRIEDSRQARAASAEAAKPETKPLPATALKLQNEDLRSIGTFNGLDADLAGLQNQIDTGKLNFGLVGNLVNKARNAAGVSSEESRNMASFQAKLENMRSAVLVLNKGVQTEGDAQRAMNEIMANINDKELVKQRLAEIRALNARAVDLKKANIDTIRFNYGHPGFDFSKYDTPSAATNLPPPGVTAPAVKDLAGAAAAEIARRAKAGAK